MSSTTAMPPLPRDTGSDRPRRRSFEDSLKAAAGLSFAALVIFAVASSLLNLASPTWLEIAVSLAGGIVGWAVARHAG